MSSNSFFAMIRMFSTVRIILWQSFAPADTLKSTDCMTVGALERFVAVSCLRSEHPALWDKYAKRRKLVQDFGRDPAEFVMPKTTTASPALAERCAYKGSNPTCQVYLHGTSPTSAVSILDTSFKVDLAGKSAGTMFGPGCWHVPRVHLFRRSFSLSRVCCILPPGGANQKTHCRCCSNSAPDVCIAHRAPFHPWASNQGVWECISACCWWVLVV